jgi:hypothetical protein
MLRRVETVGATQGLPFLRRLSAKARVLLPRTQEIKLAARRHLVPFRSSGGGQTAPVLSVFLKGADRVLSHGRIRFVMSSIPRKRCLKLARRLPGANTLWGILETH